MLRKNVVRLHALIDELHGQCILTAFEHLPWDLKDVLAGYETDLCNGCLDYPSIYQSPPSPETDEAWGRASDCTLLEAGSRTEERISGMARMRKRSSWWQKRGEAECKRCGEEMWGWKGWGEGKGGGGY